MSADIMVRMIILGIFYEYKPEICMIKSRLSTGNAFKMLQNSAFYSLISTRHSTSLSVNLRKRKVLWLCFPNFALPALPHRKRLARRKKIFEHLIFLQIPSKSRLDLEHYEQTLSLWVDHTRKIMGYYWITLHINSC